MMDIDIIISISITFLVVTKIFFNQNKLNIHLAIIKYLLASNASK